MEQKLTKEEILLIQNSYYKINKNSDELGNYFYDKFFKENPDVVLLFKGNMQEQARTLMKMIKTVIEGLNNPEIIIPAVQELGKRHKEYGVSFEQYKSFGDCLIRCIEENFPGEIDSNTKIAWEKLYNMLAEIMQGNLN
jgi:hemoglobin-like flavoprotein